MQWVFVLIIVLVLIALIAVRRSAWTGSFTFSSKRDTDLTLRTRIAEDEVRNAIDRRDGEDVAP
jgi:hypothetical protein